MRGGLLIILVALGLAELDPGSGIAHEKAHDHRDAPRPRGKLALDRGVNRSGIGFYACCQAKDWNLRRGERW